MHTSTITLPEMKLVGISARTNNAHEMNPSSARIGSTIQKYLEEDLANKIPHRKKPGITYSVYTEYESDLMGDYTYFIGEEVTSFENIPEEFKTLIIQPQTYKKFTTEPGSMPQVVIEAWRKIWRMTPQELSGKRRYSADFELYDERALDPHNTVLDIYIGVLP